MNRDFSSGILLIAGAAAGVAVMAFHPTAHHLLAGGPGAARLAGINVLVHGVALVSVPVVFLGLLGLSRRLGFSDPAIAALVVWGFGGAAVISAAVASGFVAPAVIGHMLETPEGARDVSHALLEYTGLLNQAYAKIWVVATSAAILLWSWAILAGGRLARALGVAGIVVGAALVVGVLAGHLRLNVHGFGIVTLAQSLWLVCAGLLLCRPDPRSGRPIPQPGGTVHPP